ncbi:MAG TPA: formylmethanofuran--tetrahydromethanopterin N-formyltransferase [Acetobacteraceae bacterium]|nr:formylmethanofuran--tetrahydromethanopterin N-formyltransferase [Acetobacteraceae bacterium]
MQQVIRHGVRIDDTFAEAFDLRGTALVITAGATRWARQAAVTMTGFATSIIGCGCEAAIDTELAAGATPDGRSGVRVLLFSASTAELQKQLQARVGQCVLTCHDTACYAGLSATETLRLGDGLRYFGDGWQISKRFGGRRYWRIPVMDGEFVCEGTTGMTRGAVGGGNLILMGRSGAATLRAAEAVVAAIGGIADAIAPFPGGIARSGSKVGSKYKALPASTNDAWCPTLRGAVQSELDSDTAAVLEVVIDGLSPDAVAAAMRAGLAAAIALGPERGAARISAGNYGGKLGRHHYRLLDLLA